MFPGSGVQLPGGQTVRGGRIIGYPEQTPEYRRKMRRKWRSELEARGARRQGF
jgi:hypothetical protein